MMIQVENVSKSFGDVRALDQISFEVKEEETFVLLGTSGCGKTTLLKMINRLIEPSAGNIFVGGQAIQRQSATTLRKGIGYVMQSNGLFPHYTVAQNISVVPRLLQWDQKRIFKRVNELIEKLHLAKNCLSQYPHELSGGQQQRVGLARALAANPPILLMDEAFGALDNITRSNIQNEFKALDELKRKTILMVTHDVQEAFRLGDQICIMDKGRMVQAGTPNQLLFEPANAFVENFLQDQYLQLAFKAISLRDLWKWFPKTDQSNALNVLQAEADVWTGLESFRLKQSDLLTIVHPLKGETKSVGFEQLMAAFYHYKKHSAT